MQQLPLKSGEVYIVQFLSGLLGVLEEGKKTLRTRLKAAQKEEEYSKLIEDAGEVFKSILSTIPSEKLIVLRRNLDALTMTIGVKRTAVQKEEESVVPIDSLRQICKKACMDCNLCDGGPQEMAKCDFRKHLNRVLMVDFDESDGICRAAKINWE